MRWKGLHIALLVLVGKVLAASRQDNQTICDYYAQERYGESSVITQHLLMQGIVAYAYAGGDSLPNPNPNGTGIFNKGSFNGDEVFLRSFFDGSKTTTNLNGQPAQVDWLDGGGLDPLLAFLNGSTSTAEIKRKSNQEILFSHWYVSFGKVYQCSNASQFVAKEYAPFTPAYVHKYMNLNQTEVAYFIDQLMIASKHYGFSDADIQQLSATLNTKYNNRCSSPDDNGQLNSVCFAKSCPEALYKKDCEAYNSIGPYGFKASSPTDTATGVIPTVSSPPASTATSEESKGGNSSGLSAGAIAGVAIGGAVVILIAVGMWLYFRRQQKNKPAEPAAAQNQMAETPQVPFSPQSVYSHPHDSYYSRGPHDSYAVSTIGSPVSPPPTWEQSKLAALQEMAGESPSHTPGVVPSNDQWGQMHIAEMESPDPPPGWKQQPKHDEGKKED